MFKFYGWLTRHASFIITVCTVLVAVLVFIKEQVQNLRAQATLEAASRPTADAAFTPPSDDENEAETAFNSPRS